VKAVFLEKPHKLVLRDIEIPKPRSGWDLIKVGACGICGSDVRYYMGENPWALHTLGIEEPMPSNTILGHEVAGKIVDVGDEENKDRIGERVGIIAFNTCGKCYFCRHGLHNLCENTLHIGHDGRWTNWKYIPGGYAEYMVIWDEKAHKIPDNISYIEATQLDGLAVAVHAINRGRIKPGDSVLIIGSGAIGLMAIQVAKAYGATKVIAVDIRDYPLEVAEKLGGDITINASKENMVERVLKETEIGANVVLDTVGSENSIINGLKSLARAGRYVLLAVSRRKITIDITMFAGERIITTSSNNLFPEYTTAVELLASGKVKVKPFITHIFKLDEIHEAFNIALNKEKYNAIKVVLIP